jgi:transposase
MIKYHVTLTAEERAFVDALLKKGKSAATRIQHAQVLLALDETGGVKPWAEARITEAYHVTGRTIENIRRRFVEKGFEAALERKKRERPPKIKIDGEAEAKIITLACSAPPAGRRRWTLKLLADKVVEMEILDSISSVAIGALLKKRRKTLAA